MSKKTININNTPDRIALLQNCASEDRNVSEPALVAIAAIMGKIIEQVLPIYASSNLIYSDWAYDAGKTNTFPLDMYENSGINTVRVWTQQTAGGLATSEVRPVGDFPFIAYPIYSAVSAKKKVIKNAQINILEGMIERMLQEVLRQRETNAWGTLLVSAAEARTNGEAQVMSATTPGIFQADDFNRLKTAVARLHTSWVGGTPSTTYGRKGLTDLFLSPEMMEQIRSWSYQPMNTRGVPDSAESTALGLPDAIRTQIWNASGTPSIFGVNLHELLEFGKNGQFNTIFNAKYNPNLPAANAGPAFNPATQELILGLDLSVDAFIRPVATSEILDIDTSSQFVVRPDDQFTVRQETVGFYGKQEEAYLVLDRKSIYSIFV